MHALSSSLFQNSVMILLIFKMQDMYSSNLSRIHNITSFPKRRALLPRGYRVKWLLLTEPALPRVNPTPGALLRSGMWESTCSSQRGSDSAQWEVGGAVRERALGPACSPSAHPPQTRPPSPPLPSRPTVWPAQQSWGPQGLHDPTARGKPSASAVRRSSSGLL